MTKETGLPNLKMNKTLCSLGALVIVLSCSFTLMASPPPTQEDFGNWSQTRAIMDGAKGQTSSAPQVVYETKNCRVEKKDGRYLRYCDKLQLKEQATKESSLDTITRSQFAKAYVEQAANTGADVGGFVGVLGGFVTGTILSIINNIIGPAPVFLVLGLTLGGLLMGALLGRFVGWLIGKAKVKSL